MLLIECRPALLAALTGITFPRIGSRWSDRIETHSLGGYCGLGPIIVRLATVLFAIPLLVSYASDHRFPTMFPLKALAIASRCVPEPCC
jgi:hypothetical protein